MDTIVNDALLFNLMVVTFPKDFSQVATFQMCNFPSGNFPSLSWPQRSALSLFYPRRSASQPILAALGASEGLTLFLLGGGVNLTPPL